MLKRAAPDAVDDAMATAVQFFDVELPAVMRWSCDPADVESIARPVLNVVGRESSPRFAQGADVIQRWMPHAVRDTIAGANHLLIADRPDAVAERLNAFWRQA